MRHPNHSQLNAHEKPSQQAPMSAEAIFRDEKPCFYVQGIRNPRRIMCECKHRAGNPPGSHAFRRSRSHHQHFFGSNWLNPKILWWFFHPFFVRKKCWKKSGHVIMRKIRKDVFVCIRQKKWSVGHHMESSRLLNMRISGSFLVSSIFVSAGCFT